MAMQNAEFDSYVGDYVDQHGKSIRLSGEAPEYFADYKIKELARLATAWGMKSPKILDFGSGIGNSVPAFRKYFPDVKITSSDVSGESLRTAREIHGGDEPQLEITNGRIPSEDDQFDLVFTACVFHHIPHDEHIAWLGELRRITRPGGRIVVFEHNPYNPLTLHAVRNCPFDVNAHLITSRQMRSRLVQSGWITPKTDFHIFLPAALAGLRMVEPYLRWCGLGAQYASSAVAPE